jgi:hypothetical protein
MVQVSGVPGNEVSCPARLCFEIFRPLHSSLPNPEAAGAFGLCTVPGGKLEQRVAAGRAVFFSER